MTVSSGSQEAARLEQAVEAFLERLAEVPSALLHVAPRDGEWSIGELAAHSAEIYGYWAPQIDFLRTHPGQPFGRTASDPDRIAFVAQHQHDPLEELTRVIRDNLGVAAAALRAYSDAQWATVTGLHAARGVMDMDFVSNLFLAGHAEEHLKQLDETLAALQTR